ncbi:hypothetical protein KM043_014661 [Ampulex compressa]|nr:hypothetical protein KM043_014661 [Ampulex compressa]
MAATRYKFPGFLLATCLLGTFAMISTKNQFQEEYEIVYPRIIKNEEVRSRRSIFSEIREDPEDTLFVEIGNWTLRTTKNDRLMLSSEFSAESVYSKQESDPKNLGAHLDCDLRRGELEGVEGSQVVLTICQEEIYGLLSIDGRSLFVEPLEGGRHAMFESKKVKWWSSKLGNFVSTWREELSDKTKLLRTKRDQSGAQRAPGREYRTHFVQEFYNLSGDVLDDGRPNVERWMLHDDIEETSIDQAEVVMEELPHEVDSERIGYFSDPTWQRNKLPRRKMGVRDSSPRWLEIAVAADYSVVDFHGARTQQYILALLNIVSAIYMDPSLESNMTLVIVRMILYAEKRDGMVRHGDARRSLENVNRWNGKMLALPEVRHDVAVWLTRLDIGGPSGYAPVSGLCDPARSCALNRDEGLTSAFIIAHEVAHILGLTHDGDTTTGNDCREEAIRGSVMAPMVAATFHHFYWSACSRKEFHRRVRRWSCLLNQPNVRNFTRLMATVHEAFTMDEQCRMEFGEGYELCKSFDIAEPCSRLWCGNTNVSQTCKTKKGPPLDGTLCGKSKWCINGRCASTSRARFDLVVLNKPRDGGWGTWGAWGKCSTSCGLGVQCRSRKCNKPPPAYGGKYCSGPSDDCKTCDLTKCSTPLDLRAQQCSKLTSIQNSEEAAFGSNLTWLPYEPDQENLKCQLICRGRETGEIFYTRENLIDGTPCSYGSTNVCVQGECRQMGCDNVLDSTKVFDFCGVCDGDGSECDDVLSKFQRRLRRDVTRVAILPRACRGVTGNITIPRTALFHQDNLTVVIGDGRRRRNIEDNSVLAVGESTIVHGAAFRVRKTDNETYSVEASGSPFEDVVILLVIPKKFANQGITVSVSLRYFQNRGDREKKSRYAWLFGGWSFCSVSCGGGTRQKMLLCRDEETGKIVSRRKCPLTSKPPQEIERCNEFNCNFKWLTGPWEGCSATCGSFGIRLRQLYCVHSDFNGTEINRSNELDVYRIMVRPSTCNNSQKPVTSMKCNRVPCRGHWIFTDWSSCSQNDGRNVQSRIARCVAPSGETLFDCDGPSVRTEIRACNGHATRDVQSSRYSWHRRGTK